MELPEEKICFLSLIGYSISDIRSIYNVSQKGITRIRSLHGVDNQTYKGSEISVLLRPRIYRFIESVRDERGCLKEVIYRNEIIKFLDDDGEMIIEKVVGDNEKVLDGKFKNALNPLMREYGYVPVFSKSHKFQHYKFDQMVYDERVEYEQRFFKRD